MSDKLYHNLVSGESYLTQHSDNPAAAGEVVYNNLVATAETIFGEEYTDEDMEFVLQVVGSGPEKFYDEDSTADELARQVDAYAKARGGTGWL